MTAQKQQLPRIRQRVIAWSPELKKDVPCTVVKHSSASKFWAEYHNGSHVETLKGLTKWEPVVELTGINAAIQEEVLSAEEEEVSPAGEQELENCQNLPKTDEWFQLLAPDELGIEEETASVKELGNVEKSEIWENLPKTEEEISSVEESVTVGKPKIWENLPKTEWIDPGLVICDAGTQTRCSEISELTVDNYCDRMNEGEWDFEREPLPRLIYDGKNYYPITGHHRVRAAQKARLHIYASIKLGTLEDAIYEAVRDNSNANHGLPENSRDRRHRINAFFEMFESWTDDKRQEELDKIDCFPVGKNKQKFDSWSSRSIACYLRIPASYKQVQDIQAEREQVKKYRLVLEALEIGKWYQWHNGEQVCVGKLISKSDTSFGFEHPSDTIFEWQESISSFLNSVKEIQPDDNIPVDEDEENENQDDAKKNQPTYLDRQRVSYSLKVKCRQVANLETYSNSDIAGLCEVLGDWAKINGHDGFAKGILTFAERLSSL